MTVNVRRRQSERKHPTNPDGKKRKIKKILRQGSKEILQSIPIVGDLIAPPKLSPKGHDAKVIAKWKKKNKKKKETTKVEKQRKNEANELKKLYGDWA